jgi:hypothetical protein
MEDTPKIRRVLSPERRTEPLELKPIDEVNRLFTELKPNFPRRVLQRGGGSFRESTLEHEFPVERTWLPQQVSCIERTAFLLDRLYSGNVMTTDATTSERTMTQGLPALSELIVGQYLNIPLPYRKDADAFKMAVDSAVFRRTMQFAVHYPSLLPALSGMLLIAGGAGLETAIANTSVFLRSARSEPEQLRKVISEQTLRTSRFQNKRNNPNSMIVCDGMKIASNVILSAQEAAFQILDLMDQGQIPGYNVCKISEYKGFWAEGIGFNGAILINYIENIAKYLVHEQLFNEGGTTQTAVEPETALENYESPRHVRVRRLLFRGQILRAAAIALSK